VPKRGSDVCSIAGFPTPMDFKMEVDLYMGQARRLPLIRTWILHCGERSSCYR